MALTIRWTKRAEKKFDKIIEYLLIGWNEQVTVTVVKKVYDFIDTLADFPEIGTIENKEKAIRAFTICKANKHLLPRRQEADCYSKFL